MTDGDCYVCGGTYTGRGMTRHLRSCLADRPESADTTVAHLRITDAHRSKYWLHVAPDVETTLATLDAFLRDIWVECCSHLSSFTVGDVDYVRPFTEEDRQPGFGRPRQPMDVPLGTALESDDEFDYEYDFGTPTELSIRHVETGHWSVSTGDGRIEGRPEDDGAGVHDGISVLARNHPPEIECGSCGEPASKVCQPCLWERGPDAWLCDDCATAHEDECDRPAYLPRVNSPRTGVCGYTG